MQQRKHRPLAAGTLNPSRHTAEGQWPNKLVRARKSLTEEPDDLSGKRLTKTKVLAGRLFWHRRKTGLRLPVLAPDLDEYPGYSFTTPICLSYFSGEPIDCQMDAIMLFAF